MKITFKKLITPEAELKHASGPKQVRLIIGYDHWSLIQTDGGILTKRPSRVRQPLFYKS
ncbi:MAG: hypothetical protein IPG39_04260 [Bacteroidetes bacterium]|nr:hypothetical protein [Bacteroidota bacterium]